MAGRKQAGVLRSMTFGPGLILISRQLDAGKHATAMGLFVAGGFSSSIVLNLVEPLLMEPLGWQGMFVLCEGLGEATVVAC